MAKSDEILNINEVAQRFGVTQHLVREFLMSGTLPAWRDGDGAKAMWRIPASAAERALRPFAEALTAKQAAEIAGITDSGIRQAAERGDFPVLRGPKSPDNTLGRQRLYIPREPFMRWVDRRTTRTAKAPEPALPEPLADDPPAVSELVLQATGAQASEVSDLLRQLIGEVRAVQGALRMMGADSREAIHRVAEQTREMFTRGEAQRIELTKAIQQLAGWVAELALVRADQQADQKPAEPVAAHEAGDTN